MNCKKQIGVLHCLLNSRSCQLMASLFSLLPPFHSPYNGSMTLACLSADHCGEKGRTRSALLHDHNLKAAKRRLAIWRRLARLLISSSAGQDSLVMASGLLATAAPNTHPPPPSWCPLGLGRGRGLLGGGGSGGRSKGNRTGFMNRVHGKPTQIKPIYCAESISETCFQSEGSEKEC